jgi:hypothetical protein
VNSTITLTGNTATIRTGDLETSYRLDSQVSAAEQIAVLHDQVIEMSKRVERLRAGPERVICSACGCSIPRSAAKPSGDGWIAIDLAVCCGCRLIAQGSEWEALALKRRQEIERLRQQLAAIRAHWQAVIQDIDNPWRVRMAELVGDDEGLLEAAEAAGGGE